MAAFKTHNKKKASFLSTAPLMLVFVLVMSIQGPSMSSYGFSLDGVCRLYENALPAAVGTEICCGIKSDLLDSFANKYSLVAGYPERVIDFIEGTFYYTMYNITQTFLTDSACPPSPPPALPISPSIHFAPLDPFVETVDLDVKQHDACRWSVGNLTYSFGWTNESFFSYGADPSVEYLANSFRISPCHVATCPTEDPAYVCQNTLILPEYQFLVDSLPSLFLGQLVGYEYSAELANQSAVLSQTLLEILSYGSHYAPIAKNLTKVFYSESPELGDGIVFVYTGSAIGFLDSPLTPIFASALEPFNQTTTYLNFVCRENVKETDPELLQFKYWPSATQGWEIYLAYGHYCACPNTYADELCANTFAFPDDANGYTEEEVIDCQNAFQTKIAGRDTLIFAGIIVLAITVIETIICGHKGNWIHPPIPFNLLQNRKNRGLLVLLFAGCSFIYLAIVVDYVYKNFFGGGGGDKVEAWKDWRTIIKQFLIFAASLQASFVLYALFICFYCSLPIAGYLIGAGYTGYLAHLFIKGAQCADHTDDIVLLPVFIICTCLIFLVLVAKLIFIAREIVFRLRNGFWRLRIDSDELEGFKVYRHYIADKVLTPPEEEEEEESDDEENNDSKKKAKGRKTNSNPDQQNGGKELFGLNDLEKAALSDITGSYPSINNVLEEKNISSSSASNNGKSKDKPNTKAKAKAKKSTSAKKSTRGASRAALLSTGGTSTTLADSQFNSKGINSTVDVNFNDSSDSAFTPEHQAPLTLRQKLASFRDKLANFFDGPYFRGNPRMMMTLATAVIFVCILCIYACHVLALYFITNATDFLGDYYNCDGESYDTPIEAFYYDYSAAQDKEICDEIEDIFRAIGICAIIGCVVAVIIQIINVRFIYASYKDHLARFIRGDKTFIELHPKLPANAFVNTLQYAGYQIAYVLIGWFLLAVFVFLAGYIIVVTIYYPAKGYYAIGWFWFRVLRIAYSIIGGIIFLQIQLLLIKLFFKGGQSLSLERVKWFHTLDFFMFLCNMLMGAVSFIARIAKSLIFALLFLSRLDKSIMPTGLDFLDNAYSTFIGVIHVDAYYGNPILIAFAQEMAVHNHGSKSHIAAHLSSQTTPLAIRRATMIKHSTMRKKWFVFYTLVRNPQLQKFRKSYLESKRHKSKDNNETSKTGMDSVVIAKDDFQEDALFTKHGPILLADENDLKQEAYV